MWDLAIVVKSSVNVIFLVDGINKVKVFNNSTGWVNKSLVDDESGVCAPLFFKELFSVCKLVICFIKLSFDKVNSLTWLFLISNLLVNSLINKSLVLSSLMVFWILICSS